MDYFSTISMSSVFIQFIYWYKFRTGCSHTSYVPYLDRKSSPRTMIFNSSFLCITIVSRSVMSDSLQPHGLYILPGSSVHGILQARILEWVAVPSSRGSFWPRESNPCLPYCRQILYHLSQKGRPLHHSPNAKFCKTSKQKKPITKLLPAKVP